MVKLKILNSTDIHSWGESVPFQSQVFLNTVAGVDTDALGTHAPAFDTSSTFVVGLAIMCLSNRNFDNNNNNNFIYIAVYAEAYRLTITN